MDNLINKHILVIGAAGLLGKSVCQGLLAEGATIICADISLEVLANVFGEENSHKLNFTELDITDENAIKSYFATSEAIDGVVNCSYPRNKHYGAHFFDVSLESFNENLSLHLGSSFLLMQQCAAYFIKHQQAFSLVNIASIYGVVAPDFSIYDNTTMTMPVEYAAIKSALLHLNKYAVKYVADSNFRINSVSPGGIFDSQNENFLKAYQSKTNGQGMLSVDDLQGAVNFLLSEQSKFITGQNIVVDDGFTL